MLDSSRVSAPGAGSSLGLVLVRSRTRWRRASSSSGSASRPSRPGSSTRCSTCPGRARPGLRGPVGPAVLAGRALTGQDSAQATDASRPQPPRRGPRRPHLRPRAADPRRRRPRPGRRQLLARRRRRCPSRRRRTGRPRRGFDDRSSKRPSRDPPTKRHLFASPGLRAYRPIQFEPVMFLASGVEQRSRQAIAMASTERTSRHVVSLARQTPRFASAFGSIAHMDASNLPIMRGLSMRRLILAAHGVREPHWHANAARARILHPRRGPRHHRRQPCPARVLRDLVRRDVLHSVGGHALHREHRP